MGLNAGWSRAQGTNVREPFFPDPVATWLKGTWLKGMHSIGTSRKFEKQMWETFLKHRGY